MVSGHYEPSRQNNAEPDRSSWSYSHTAMFDPDYDAVYSLGQESAMMILRWTRSDGRQK